MRLRERSRASALTAFAGLLVILGEEDVLSGTASQSSTTEPFWPGFGHDGDDGTMSMTEAESNPWWQLDLGSSRAVGIFRLLNRADDCSNLLFVSNPDCDRTFKGGTFISSDEGAIIGVSDKPCSEHRCWGESCAHLSTPRMAGHTYDVDCRGKVGRYVYIILYGSRRLLNFIEATVFPYQAGARSASDGLVVARVEGAGSVDFEGLAPDTKQLVQHLRGDPEGPLYTCRDVDFDVNGKGPCCGLDSVAAAAGLSPWPGAEALLPNFDCWDITWAEELWENVGTLRASIALLEATGSVRAGGWLGHEAEKAIWVNYARLFFQNRHAGPGSSDAALSTECPFAFHVLQIARWSTCMFAERDVREPGCAELRVQLGHVLLDSPFGLCRMESALSVLMNSRWFWLSLQLIASVRPYVAQFENLLDPHGLVKNFYDCTGVHGESGVNWDDYAQLLTTGKTEFSGRSTMNFLFGRQGKQPAMARECIVGFFSMTLEKLRVTQTMKSEDYAGFANSVGVILHELEKSNTWDFGLRDSFSLLMMSRFPVTGLLSSICAQSQAMRQDQASFGYQHKPYELDFHPNELFRSPIEQEGLAALREMSAAAHADHLRVFRRRRLSSTMRALLRALETPLQQRAGVDAAAKVILVTMIWGSRLSGYLPAALGRAEGFGLAGQSLVFCLDDAGCHACQEAHRYPANCVPGRLKTIYNKYTILSAVINAGFDALYLDFDTVLMRNPLPDILAAADNAEVLVSRDFGSRCLNTGVIYLKAHADTARFLATLLTWLWHHPYEFSQKAFSAFFGVERVVRGGPLERPMKQNIRWNILDPMNGFVTSTVYDEKVEGWTGNMEDIVIFHFLDGTGGVDPERAVVGEYVNLYDLFFANPRLDMKDVAKPLWKQDPRVETALLRSRKPAPPASVQKCQLYPEPEEARIEEAQRVADRIAAERAAGRVVDD